MRVKLTFLNDSIRFKKNNNKELRKHPKSTENILRRRVFSFFLKKLDKIRLVTVQLLKALGFLQQQNVLHADLKPENILLSKGLDV